MAVCPMCQKEFGPAVTMCPECNVPLQGDGEPKMIPMFSLQKEEDAKGFVDYAAEKSISCAYEFSSRENAYKIFVDEKSQKKGPKIFAEYCMNVQRKKKGLDPVESEEILKKRPAPVAEPVAEPAAVEEQAQQANPKNETEAFRNAMNALFENKKRSQSSSAFSSVKTEPASKPYASTYDAPEPATPKVASTKDTKPVTAAASASAPSPAPAPTPFAPVKMTSSAKPKKNFMDDPDFLEFGNYGKPKEESSKHPDLLNLFNNPAQNAPKRDQYNDFSDPAQSTGNSKFTVAPGEDSLYGGTSDPFYNRPKTSFSVKPQVKEPEPSNQLEAEIILDDFNSLNEPEIVNQDDFNLPEVAEDIDEINPEEISFSDDIQQSAPENEPTINLTNDNSSLLNALYGIDELTVPDPEPEFEPENEEVDVAEPEPAAVTYEYSTEPDFEPDESDSYIDEPVSESNTAPIFVEVEPIKDEDLDADNIVEAVDVITLENDEPEEEITEEEDDSYAIFLQQFKKASEKKEAAAAAAAAATDSNSELLDNFIQEMENANLDKTDLANSVIDEVVPNKEKYDDPEDYKISSTSGRPKDIQDTKIKVSAESNIIEEVIDTNVDVGTVKNASESASSTANPNSGTTDLSKATQKVSKPKKDDFSDLEEYKGFVPDYTFEEKKEDVEETEQEAAYRQFTEKVAERKRENQLAESQKKKEEVRKVNNEGSFGKKGKIVFEDTEELDSYAGFIPDYKPNTENKEEFDFYKPHTVSNYSKYKKGKKNTAEANVTNITHMRTTNNDEIQTVFIDKIPAGLKNNVDPSLVRTTGFLLSMSGKQLSQLFNSWLMLNITTAFVKQFEVADATPSENAEKKVEGIKNVLKNTFGELNESFLDYVVRRYYSKYLEE